MVLKKTKYQGKRLAVPEGRAQRSDPPVKEKTVRAEETIIAAEEKAAPVAEKIAPVEEKIVPSEEKAASVEEKSVPAAEQAIPAERVETKREAPPPAQIPEQTAPEETGQAKEPEQKEEKGSKQSEKKTEKQGFWANYGYLLVTAAVVILVFRVLLQLAFVPSGSMESTIPTDSLIISWQLPYLVSDPQPQRGDVITFWNQELNKLLVKRVIGLPGEEITFSDGFVYVNGERLEEEYLGVQGITRSEKSFQVPEGCLFMLGDNRTCSTDSRYWDNPYVSVSDVRARALVCIPVSHHMVSFLPGWKGLPLPMISSIHLIG